MMPSYALIPHHTRASFLYTSFASCQGIILVSNFTLSHPQVQRKSKMYSHHDSCSCHPELSNLCQHPSLLHDVHKENTELKQVMEVHLRASFWETQLLFSQDTVPLQTKVQRLQFGETLFWMMEKNSRGSGLFRDRGNFPLAHGVS